MFFSLKNVVYAKISPCIEKGLMLQDTEQVFCNANLFITSHSHKYTQNLCMLKGYVNQWPHLKHKAQGRGVTTPCFNSVP